MCITIEEIKSIISEFGIDSSKIGLHSKLGESEIGLDSQEIVDFTCMVEKRFNIKLPSACFIKKNTLEEVTKCIQEKFLPRELFEGKVEVSLKINCLAEEAYKAIYEMEKWPEKLPHVKRIETLYNDGVYQEFLMDVQSDTGMIQVRSIRRCLINEEITFFQPNPPKFLKHHCGGWSFQKEGSACQIKTWHEWNVKKEKAEEMFPLQTQNHVANLLQSHAELALNTWKILLEKTS
ncbi:MAG: phosphopantetheine-binding protein [Chlamydiales bacterium]|nr:phosphopantetheine-binding protein [Chlamydiales bacterium]